jgi:hypothetical protein
MVSWMLMHQGRGRTGEGKEEHHMKSAERLAAETPPSASNFIAFGRRPMS